MLLTEQKSPFKEAHKRLFEEASSQGLATYRKPQEIQDFSLITSILPPQTCGNIGLEWGMETC